jgi:hypothetical protein
MLSTQKSNTPEWKAYFQVATFLACGSQWPHGLKRWSAAARLLRLWVRIPPVAWTSVCCECCVLSGRGLCDELITRPEESYWLWRVVVWFRNLAYEEALAHWVLSHQKQNITCIFEFLYKTAFELFWSSLDACTSVLSFTAKQPKTAVKANVMEVS